MAGGPTFGRHKVEWRGSEFVLQEDFDHRYGQQYLHHVHSNHLKKEIILF